MVITKNISLIFFFLKKDTLKVATLSGSILIILYLTSCKRWLVAITSSFVLSIILTATSCPVFTCRASLTTAKCPLPNVRPRWYSPLRSERLGLLLRSRCPSWPEVNSPEESMFETKRGCGSRGIELDSFRKMER